MKMYFGCLVCIDVSFDILFPHSYCKAFTVNYCFILKKAMKLADLVLLFARHLGRPCFGWKERRCVMGTEGGRFLFVRPTSIRYEHTLVSGFGPIYCKCGGQQSITCNLGRTSCTDFRGPQIRCWWKGPQALVGELLFTFADSLRRNNSSSTIVVVLSLPFDCLLCVL